jgi:sec-independent protein translocase protein TatB
MNIFSNIGITELIVILLLALLVVGPERLPEMGRRLAEILRDLRRAYDNLTKELGPELQSIQQTTQELRDSVESVTSIPRDTLKTVVDAAELDDTISELKDVTGELEEVRQTMSRAGKTIKNPVGAAVDTAKETLLPSKSDESDEPDDSAAGDEQLREEIDAAVAQLAQDTPEEQVSD